MSYSALIDSNLIRAFNLVKDLAVDAVLIKNSKKDFNFATGIAESSNTQLPVKVIIMEDKKNARGSEPSKEVNSIVRQVMVRTKSVGDLTTFDSLLINGATWKFTNLLQTNTYITVAEISKEL